MFHIRGCAHSRVQGQPAPVTGPPRLSGKFKLWGQRGPWADLWGGWGLIKGKGRFMQSSKAIRGPYSLILFISLLQKLALKHMGLFYEVSGF